jgi:hypothetical protein
MTVPYYTHSRRKRKTQRTFLEKDTTDFFRERHNNGLFWAASVVQRSFSCLSPAGFVPSSVAPKGGGEKGIKSGLIPPPSPYRSLPPVPLFWTVSRHTHTHTHNHHHHHHPPPPPPHLLFLLPIQFCLLRTNKKKKKRQEWTLYIIIYKYINNI